MKKLICMLLALTLPGAGALAEVAVDEANFPDGAFRDVVKGFDTDGDVAPSPMPTQLITII